METKIVNVIVTTTEGEVLDRISLSIPCNPDYQNAYIAVKPVNYSIGINDSEEILTLGNPAKLP